MRAAIPQMLEQDNGVIINISSGAANSALVGWSHYTVATDMMKKIRDAKINPVSNLDWDSHLPPESVGEGVAFLCTEKGAEFDGTDFSLKTDEGRKLVGLA